MFYNARWYDPALGRFAQADTIIPGAGNPQAWDRYAYANNNPVRYNDPSGHYTCSDIYCHGGPSIRFRYGKGGPVSGGVRKDDNNTCLVCITRDESQNGLKGDTYETGMPNLQDPLLDFQLKSLLISFPAVDIEAWRMSIKLEKVVTARSGESDFIISNDGIIVGDDKVGYDNSITTWLTNELTQSGPYTYKTRMGIKASMDSVKIVGRGSLSYPLGDDTTVDIRSAAEVEYRPKNIITALGVFATVAYAPDIIIRGLSQGGGSLCPGPLCP